MGTDHNSNLTLVDASGFYGDVSTIGNVSEKVLSLRKHLVRLETELIRIRGFEHQLPMCVLILEKAIAKIYKEIKSCMEMKSMVVTKEFLPLESGNLLKEKALEETTEIDKKDWLKSAKLWNNNHNTTENCVVNKQDLVPRLNMDEVDVSKFQNPYEQISKRFRNCEGFPIPFPGPSNNLQQNFGNPMIDVNVNRSYTSYLRPSVPPFLFDPSKKPRRSWSAELHGRFMVACEKLGGAYVATPKQIKEMMGIEDLTTDEIKSHLQKYRIHIKKNPPTSASSAAASAVSSPSTASSSWMIVEGSYTRGRSVFQYSSTSPDGPLIHIQRPPFSAGFAYQGGIN